MKFAPMNYHYLRYPIKKFLDKVERSPFNSMICIVRHRSLICSIIRF